MMQNKRCWLEGNKNSEPAKRHFMFTSNQWVAMYAAHILLSVTICVFLNGAACDTYAYARVLPREYVDIICSGACARHQDASGRLISAFLLHFTELARDVYASGTYLDGNATGSSASAQSQNLRTWAPECLQDDVFSIKSDVWAFGV